MQENASLVFNPVSPQFYKYEGNAAVVREFVRYIREMGEEPAKYRSLLRIPVPPHCEYLFRSPATVTP